MICCHAFAVTFVVAFAVTLTTKVTTNDFYTIFVLRSVLRSVVWIFAKRSLDFRKTVFSGPLCAHGGSERPNCAALHVTKLFFKTWSPTLSLAVRHDSDFQRSYGALSAFERLRDRKKR